LIAITSATLIIWNLHVKKDPYEKTVKSNNEAIRSHWNRIVKDGFRERPPVKKKELPATIEVIACDWIENVWDSARVVVRRTMVMVGYGGELVVAGDIGRGRLVAMAGGMVWRRGLVAVGLRGDREREGEWMGLHQKGKEVKYIPKYKP